MTQTWLLARMSKVVKLLESQNVKKSNYKKPEKILFFVT